MVEPTDAELVGRTQAGDADAYRELVARYQGHVYGLAYSILDNWADAQDMAQEGFIRAYCNLGQLRDPCLALVCGRKGPETGLAIPDYCSYIASAGRNSQET